MLIGMIGHRAADRPRAHYQHNQMTDTNTLDRPAQSPKEEAQSLSFSQLKLPKPLLGALEGLGYETPSPIQAQAIPHLLAGRDVLGHAPTGTGKTAAFALPLLARIDDDSHAVQILTLTPTRELAIQVAEAFQSYAAKLKNFHVLPVYGGQEYNGQIRALKRGVQVVVGTPGRVTDHMRRGTLRLDKLSALVLDEADEMLRMGFIDEVEWILEQTPSSRQTALFSATMPKEIERIARRHLNNPQEVAIKSKTATAETIRQRAWVVSGIHKLDALTRILEVEDFDAILIFVRTRSATGELADRLAARGYSTAALNGDMPQKQREQTIDRLKKKKLDILVATDVAARGLDVDRISHVINFDIPHDTEAYIHRIGRTGRAGRTGEAILFAAPRERRMLNAIERATRKEIEKLELPTIDQVNEKRVDVFKQRVVDRLAGGDLEFMRDIIAQLQQEHEVSAQDIAAALAHLSLGGQPLLLTAGKRNHRDPDDHAQGRSGNPRRERAGDRNRERREPRGSDKRSRASEANGPRAPRERKPRKASADNEMFRIAVGHEHGVEPSNIVGAIANEAGIDAQHIGHISIFDGHSEVELPKGMPREIFEDLKKVWVCGQKLNIARVDSGSDSKPREPSKRPNSNPNSNKKQNKKIKLAKLDHKDKKKNKKPKAKKKGNKNKGKRRKPAD